MAAHQGLLLVLLLFEATWSHSRGQLACPQAAVPRAQAVAGQWCLTASL